MKTTVYRGKIEEFRGSWMSGLATLIISGKAVYCDNAPTVRALDSCFGDVIGNAHNVKQSGIVGKDIVYSMDEIGTLEAFTPTKDWRAMHGSKRTPKLGESKEIEVGETS